MKQLDKSKKIMLVCLAGVIIIAACVLFMSGNKPIETPCDIDGGKIAIKSIFPSSVENPDNEFEYGDDIATIELTNQSGKYLESAVITVKLSDKTELHFTAEDIPDGKSAWAFETDNQAVVMDPECVKIKCEAKYGKAPGKMKKQVAATIDFTNVTLKNLTGDDLTNLTVKAHCLFDDMYYGGKSYTYPIDEIKAGQEYTFDAAECYMNTAELVEISQNEK